MKAKMRNSFMQNRGRNFRNSHHYECPAVVLYTEMEKPNLLQYCVLVFDLIAIHF